jgi:hypothetical protein
VEVQVPGLTVVAVKLRPRASVSQHRVQKVGGFVHLAGLDGIEYRA